MGEVALRSDVRGGRYIVFDDSSTYALSGVSTFSVGNRHFVNHGVVEREVGREQVKERLLEQVAPSEHPFLDFYIPFGARRVEPPYPFFAKRDEAIQPVDYATLRAAMLNDPESIQRLDASRKWMWTRNAMYVGGSLTLLYGFFRSFDLTRLNQSDTYGGEGGGVFQPHALLFVGAGILVAGVVPNLRQRARFRAAIRVYDGQ